MSSVEKNKVTSLEIIVRMVGDKPYYELKYREVGKEYYSVGYSSYDLKIVLDYIDTYFEIVENDRQTNADRIRNMSDEELAKKLYLLLDCRKCPTFKTCNMGSMCYANLLEWLQSEAELRGAE